MPGRSNTEARMCRLSGYAAERDGTKPRCLKKQC